ncbi:amidohydrolase family protein [Lacimicrobium sp. SS2-24]|uniref:amidohydrolase family protein n=1 Tax=Lacimicrobium sp. SS2-24 TaxID=2005569 RepID=UPI000B4B3234|nr:amidohydrolase family protein [Lacimicrobium sp. SS2-24]
MPARIPVLPIKMDTTSNGEFVPPRLSQREKHINQLADQQIDLGAHRLGLDRRTFMLSTCAAATTLLCANKVNAAAGLTGGFYQLSGEAAMETEPADAALMGDEFIFDIQGHFVDPNGRWLNQLPEQATPFAGMPGAACSLADIPGDRSYLQCLGPKQFVKDVFMDSDTNMMVLSFVPSRRENEPLTIEEADATRRIIDELEGDQRLLLHGRVNPNQDGDLQGMEELAEKWQVSAWKTYTQWGPEGQGFFLHEAPGIAMIEKARQLGVNNICIHKGIPFGQQSYEHSLCTDIGIVAKAFPDINFIIYHSGFDPGVEEQAFNQGAGRAGTDSLVQSLIDNDIAPNTNVYAELGSTWRFVMRHPEQAAHLLGKLIRYVGENNVLWGTDSIWYGSPQDQIQAFRSFQISDTFQQQYGYSSLTPTLKRKIFGLNATKPYQVSIEEVQRFMGKDRIATSKAEYQQAPQPHFKTYGPKTRREFLNLMKWQQG